MHLQRRHLAGHLVNGSTQPPRNAALLLVQTLKQLDGVLEPRPEVLGLGAADGRTDAAPRAEKPVALANVGLEDLELVVRVLAGGEVRLAQDGRVEVLGRGAVDVGLVVEVRVRVDRRAALELHLLALGDALGEHRSW